MAREWQKKRRNSTLKDYLSIFYLSSVINRQGQTPFPRKKRGQKPRYNKEFQTTRRNTAAQPRLGGDLTKLHCGSQDQAGNIKGPSAWHSEKQRKLKFSKISNNAHAYKSHTHAHGKTRARASGKYTRTLRSQIPRNSNGSPPSRGCAAKKPR